MTILNIVAIIIRILFLIISNTLTYVIEDKFDKNKEEKNSKNTIILIIPIILILFDKDPLIISISFVLLLLP